MVLENYRHLAPKYLDPIVWWLRRGGITANAVSAASLILGVVAALFFGLAVPGNPGFLVAGAVFVAGNAIFDAVDGRLARITKTTSRRGDYLDHVFDRYADAAILIGLSLSAFGNLALGIFAIVGTLLTSYMGTQAQALGLGRDYSGLLGRADRMVLLILVPLAEYERVAHGVGLLFGLTYIDWLLVYLAVIGNLTALQRFAKGWRDLGS